jgi:PAS domain S-box-containing protein
MRFLMTPRTKARAVFLSALALLCLCGVAVYLSFVDFRESEHWVSHTQEVRAVLGDLEATVNAASRARMRYLISGDLSELAAYRAASRRVQTQMLTLQQLTRDNSVQIENCKRFETITNSRLQAWEELIVEKQQGASIEIPVVVQQNLDFATQGAAVAEQIRAEEVRLLQERVQVAYRRFDLTRGVVVTSFALALILLYVHYRWMTAELEARGQAEQGARMAYAHEMALRQEEERFRLFIAAVQDYAIFLLDTQGCISSWNPGAQRLKGYTTEEILGRHFSCFYPVEDVEAGKPQRELEIAARDGRIEDEGWRVRKTGSRFWANVIITALRDDQGKLIGFAKITRDFTERMLAQEALRERNLELVSSEKALRNLSAHLLRTQDEERKRIGRDLHDSLGQYLAALKLSLELLKLNLDGNQNDATVTEIDKCIQLAEESIREMRTISYLLYPPMLEEVGLKSAIRWYIEGFSQRSQIVTTFDCDPHFGRLSSDAELALFRILQEGLTNVHRHSGSKTANIRLFTADGRATLEVQDQGNGFRSNKRGEEWLRSAGVGLRGMAERMRQFGGDLQVSSTENGTVVTARIPLDTPDSELIESAKISEHGTSRVERNPV